MKFAVYEPSWLEDWRKLPFNARSRFERGDSMEAHTFICVSCFREWHGRSSRDVCTRSTACDQKYRKAEASSDRDQVNAWNVYWKTCDWLPCGSTFMYREGRRGGDDRRFCSLDCGKRHHREPERLRRLAQRRIGIEFTCENCGASYRQATRQSHKRRTCSDACRIQLEGQEFVSRGWLLDEPYTGSSGTHRVRCVFCHAYNWLTRKAMLSGDACCDVCGSNEQLRRIGQSYFVYFMKNTALAAMKVGIADDLYVRQSQLAQYGWAPYLAFDVHVRRLAVNIEQDILRYWREDLRLPFGASRVDMGIASGVTETAPFDIQALQESANRVSSYLHLRQFVTADAWSMEDAA